MFSSWGKKSHSSWKPQWQSVLSISIFSFFLSWRFRLKHTWAFLIAYFVLDWQLGNVFLVFLSEELHDHSLFPFWEWEIRLSIQFLSVFGAVKWCLTRYSSQTFPSLPTLPDLALWLTKTKPEEEAMLKDTAKSDCGTSQFVIVCFKCFCKNVVTCQHATKPGCLGLVQIFCTFIHVLKLQI